MPKSRLVLNFWSNIDNNTYAEEYLSPIAKLTLVALIGALHNAAVYAFHTTNMNHEFGVNLVLSLRGS